MINKPGTTKFLNYIIGFGLIISLFLLFGLLLFEAFTLSELKVVEDYNKELTMEAEKMRNHIVDMRNNSGKEVISKKDEKLNLYIKNLEDNKLITILPGGKPIEHNFYTACFFIEKGYIKDPRLKEDIEKIRDVSLYYKYYFKGGNDKALFLVGDEATLQRIADYDFRKPLKEGFKREHMQEGFSYQTVTNPNLHRKEFMVADMQKVNKQLALFLERYGRPEWIRGDYKGEHKIKYPKR